MSQAASTDSTNDRANLVTAQTQLGKCRGSLQGLRHECLGLVNWYQTIPSMYPRHHTLTHLTLPFYSLYKVFTEFGSVFF